MTKKVPPSGSGARVEIQATLVEDDASRHRRNLAPEERNPFAFGDEYGPKPSRPLADLSPEEKARIEKLLTLAGMRDDEGE